MYLGDLVEHIYEYYIAYIWLNDYDVKLQQHTLYIFIFKW